MTLLSTVASTLIQQRSCVGGAEGLAEAAEAAAAGGRGNRSESRMSGCPDVRTLLLATPTPSALDPGSGEAAERRTPHPLAAREGRTQGKAKGPASAPGPTACVGREGQAPALHSLRRHPKAVGENNARRQGVQGLRRRAVPDCG